LECWGDRNTPVSQTLGETLLRIKQWECDIIQILSITTKVKVRAVARFRVDELFPDDPDVNRRVAYLMRIEGR
jgi:hypothetical protein